MSAELMASVAEALQLPHYTRHFWCDSKVVRQWITNFNLRLPKFVARRLDSICQVSSTSDYCETKSNSAGVTTRPLGSKHFAARRKFWIEGSQFLYLPPDKFNVDSIVSDARIKLNTNSCKESKATFTRVIRLHQIVHSEKEVGLLCSFCGICNCKDKERNIS